MLVLALALLIYAICCFVVVAWLYPDDAVPQSGANVFAAAFEKRQLAINGSSKALKSGEDHTSDDGPLLTYLKSTCCAIPVYPQRDGTTFAILKSPSEFFQQLKAMIMAAETKISISALYVGDGELSREFVKCLESRVESKVIEIQTALSTSSTTTEDVATTIIKPLQIEIVLDYNRMHHRANLRTLKRLLELGSELHVLHERLMQEKPHLVGRQGHAATVTSVRLHLFQTPSQLNRFYPPKFFGRAREILGVQHTKLFSFDRKDVIATGANLSDDYFITRMDRYAVVRDCKGLGVWYDEAIHTLTLMSYEVTAETSSSSSASTSASPSSNNNNSAGNDSKRVTSDVVTPKMTPKSVVCASPASALPPAPFSLSGPPPSCPTTQPKKSTHKMTELIIRHCPMGFDATDHTDAFIAASKVVWASFIDRVANMPECGMVGASSATSDAPPLTWIFPTLQFGRAGLHHDSIIVEEMVKGLASLDVHHYHHLAAAAAGGNDTTKIKAQEDPTAAFYFTSPYMNCYPELVRCMQQTSYTPTIPSVSTTTTSPSETTSIFNFITASINTNGWKGQRGFAGLIPSFYLQLLRNFHYLMKQLGLSDRVGVFEYSEAGMTFHSKGLWICSSTTKSDIATEGNDNVKAAVVNERRGGEMPFLAAYGSTNYGHRSVHKDVESEILIYTQDPSLRHDMGEELQRLLTHSTPVVEKTLFLGAKAPGRFRPVVAAVAHMGHRFL